MKQILLILHLLTFPILAQAQCGKPLPPSNTCDTAPILCDLDGYCTNNATFTNSGTPNAFCGVVENNCWLSFIAGSTVMEIEITVDNCNQGTGLQADIFQTEDCNIFTSVSNCLDPVNGVAILSATNLFIGERYYIMLDGKGGDVCDFSFDVLEGLALSAAEAIIVEPVIFCAGQTAVIDGSNSINNGATTFTWSVLNEGLIISEANSNMLTIGAPGEYILIVQDADNLCSDTAVVLVNEFALPVIEIEVADELDCLENLTIGLAGNVNANNENYTYLWTTNNGNILSGSSSLTPTVSVAGVYNLQVTDNDTGCSSTAEIEVFQDVETPNASIFVNGELNCITDTLLLNGLGSSIGNNFMYEWKTALGNIIDGQDFLTPLIDAAGIYTLIISNANNGCVDSTSVDIIRNFERPESAFISATAPCFGEGEGLIRLDSIIGGTPPFMYFYEPMGFNVGNELRNLEAGEYAVNVIDAIGCEWDTSLVLQEVPFLEVSLGEDIILALEDSIDLEAALNFPRQLVDTIIWKASDSLSCEGCFTQVVKSLDNALYTVVVSDENGCTASDEINIIVQKDRRIFIPNAFSPNGDGYNDWFTIFGGRGVSQINKLRIFNRWGGLLYAQQNYPVNDPNYSWDGRFKGEILDPGIFIYYVEVLFVDGRVEVFEGDVLLMH